MKSAKKIFNILSWIGFVSFVIWIPMVFKLGYKYSNESMWMILWGYISSVLLLSPKFIKWDEWEREEEEK